MRYVDEFRDKRLIDKVAQAIREKADRGRSYRIMDVCGTHTMNIFKFGLKDILPANIDLVSGPGCPVCVTANDFLDKTIALSRMKNTIITTFGDMFRVPGSHSSLEKERAGGRDIRIMYSSLDALNCARKNPDKEVIFLGVGFETTSPTVAASISIAKIQRLKNYSVLCGHKTMPNALRTLVSDDSISIDGFILPGHVSAIIGLKPYGFLSKKYGKRCVVAGFEALDILEAILMIIEQKTPKVEVEYPRIINKRGNVIAQKAIAKIFEEEDSNWRGLGLVRKSGLRIRKRYSDFDADCKFKPKVGKPKENKGCVCGDVLKGIKRPSDCKLFGKVCNPTDPVGSCMVSSEGTCAAYYKYSNSFSV